MSDNYRWWRWWIVMGVVLAVCWLLYRPALHGPFLFDDFPNLAALTSIDHVSTWRDLGIYLSQPRGFPGRPLSMLSFLLQKGAWPDHPFPFKLVNLGIHLACGLLVYQLVRVVARAYWRNNSNPRVNLAALLAAAAWLLNPIQLSGVTLVVQRMTLLMALFLLLGLLAYLHGLLREEKSPLRRGGWMLLGLWVCAGLSFLSKENGILLLVFALVLDATVLRAYVTRLSRGLWWWRRLLIWPVVLFVLAYLIHAGWAQFGRASDVRDFTEGQRLLTEPRVLWNYISRIFLPRFGVYGVYHDGYVISRTLVSPWTTLPALLAVIAAGIGAIFARKRWPLLSLAVLWYLGGQLLESSTIMLELYFEHRNYTPSIGLFMAGAIAICSIDDYGRRRLALIASSAWIVACCITTGLSAAVYQSADRLAAAWAHQQPDSIRAQTMLANQLYLHGRIGAATKVIERAQRLHPLDTGLAEIHLYMDCLAGTATSSDVEKLKNLLTHAPFSASGYENLKQLRLMAQSGTCRTMDAAVWKSLANTLLSNPAYANYGISAGYLHYQLSELAVAQGDLNAAIAQLKATYGNDPDAEIPRLEAKYLASAGLYREAIQALQQADYSRLPLLRRLLVNDRAINAEDIRTLRKREAAHSVRKDDGSR